MSSDYTAVSAELKRGTPAEVLCTTCPWHRPCVMPPPMTEHEYRRKVEESSRGAKDSEGGAMGTLVVAALLGGQVTSGPMCPVFALRLGGPDGREVAEVIRSHMRGDH